MGFSLEYLHSRAVRSPLFTSRPAVPVRAPDELNSSTITSPTVAGSRFRFIQPLLFHMAKRRNLFLKFPVALLSTGNERRLRSRPAN
jgi:hypothetical protein